MIDWSGDSVWAAAVPGLEIVGQSSAVLALLSLPVRPPGRYSSLPPSCLPIVLVAGLDSALMRNAAAPCYLRRLHSVGIFADSRLTIVGLSTTDLAVVST